MRVSRPRARSMPSESISSLRSSAWASACTSSMRCSCSQIWPVSGQKCTCERRSSAALATKDCGGKSGLNSIN
jgi:hypothetical protein